MVEITDILTWVQAFTIYAWVFCNAHPNRWQDLTRYKLLIMQTARQFPGPAWQTYDVAFRKDAAASGLADWSKMNLDLYNFHTGPLGYLSPRHPFLGLSQPSHFPLRRQRPPRHLFLFRVLQLQFTTAAHGTTGLVAGLSVNAVFVMSASVVMGTIP